jgi:hypothetical protein
MSAGGRIAGAVLAVGLIGGVTYGSNVQMASHSTPDALLRLAWSARPERVEDCRQRSDAELAQLPQHMRQAVVCDGTTAEYRLQVRVGGTLAVDRVVHGGGLRHDRRLYVLEEVPVPPGDDFVEVRFDRLGPGASSASQASERAARVESVPPHLSFERHVVFSPRQVVLITYAAETQGLVSLSASAIR